MWGIVGFQGPYLQTNDLPHLLEIIIVAGDQADGGALGRGGDTDDKIFILIGADGVVVVFVPLGVVALADLLSENGTGAEARGGEGETALEVLDLTVLIDPLLVRVVVFVATVVPDDDLCTGIDGA